MNRLTLLADLQSLDGRIQENRQARDLLAIRLADQSAVSNAHTAFEEAAEHAHQLGLRLRDLELEVKGLDEQIRGVMGKLYGGQVTNAKELSGLTKDEAMLKRHKGELEDRMLELMAELEGTQARLEASRAALDDARATRNHDQTEDAEQLKGLEAVAVQQTKEHQALRARLSPADLQVYDSLYQSKKGRVIAQIKGTSCAACGYTIPSGLASRARIGEDLVFCANCGRILVP